MQGLVADGGLDGRRALIDDALRRNIESADDVPDIARQALRHATSGGKRIRPTVTLLACESVGGDVRRALDAAVAIEFIHCASLVMDDVIDEDAIRRSHDCIHVEFGTDVAILAGMMLTTRALKLVLHEREIVEECVAAVDDLSIGELMDVRAGNVDVDGYVSMAGMKTGALFRLAAASGALLGGATAAQRAALRAFGHKLGIAFQIRDDVLDARGNDQSVEKASGSDLLLGRPSMVSVVLSQKLGVALPQLAEELDRMTNDGVPDPVPGAIDDAMSASRAYAREAVVALEAIPASAPRRHLAELVEYAVSRAA